MAEIVAICLSDRRGIQKRPVPAARLRENHGIVGDAHAGDWHRQVSLLAQESVDALAGKIGYAFQSGDFAENILTKGICLYELPVGTRLTLGEALAEVTQIGKECHQDCAIRRAAGDCVMPREGIFVRILRGGEIHPGDKICVLSDPET